MNSNSRHQSTTVHRNTDLRRLPARASEWLPSGWIRFAAIGLYLAAFAATTSGQETEPSPINSLEAAKNAYFAAKLPRARELLTPLAELGDAEASHYLALVERQQSHKGKGSLPRAISLWRSAAAQGFAPAMWELGSIYDNGDGVSADIILALHWYRLAERIERDASDATDTVYLDPASGPDFDSLTLRARAGDAEAAYAIGRLFDLGERIESNLEKAIQWYEEAAMHGHRQSALLLAYFACSGQGMRRDTLEANQWLARANEPAACNDQF